MRDSDLGPCGLCGGVLPSMKGSPMCGLEIKIARLVADPRGIRELQGMQTFFGPGAEPLARVFASRDLVIRLGENVDEDPWSRLLVCEKCAIEWRGVPLMLLEAIPEPSSGEG